MTGKQITTALSLVALLCVCGYAQTTTGSMLGTVTDPSGAAVPGVSVELRNPNTGFARTTTTGAEGMFRFNSLEPAQYEIAIKPSSGFRPYSQKDIVLNASENRDLGKIALALGSITEEVSVTAIVTPVQTASSENSKLVDATQVSNITTKGRDLFGLLVMVPGMSSSGGDSTGNTSLIGVTLNGNSAVTGGILDGKVTFAVDGIADMAIGANMSTAYEPNMDSIAELRVLTSNYQAEYGKSSGGQIQVVTKGGSQQFHGSAWANKRHEMFNAKTFFNNYNNQAKSQYRFFVWGYSIGGPVAIPKLPNFLKKKLFFFASNEFTRQKPGTQITYAMVPTAAQRAGNFAGYSDGNGKAYSLRDPTTGNPAPNNNLAPYVGVVGNAQSATAGQAMLNFFPLPNLCNAASGATPPAGCLSDPDSTQNYKRNNVSSFVLSHPRRNDNFRLDWNATSKLNVWARYINDFDISYNGPGIPLKNAQGQFTPWYQDNPFPGHGWAGKATYTVSPTLVNEATFGRTWSVLAYYVHDESQTARSQMGNPPSFDNFATDPSFTNDQNLPRPAGLSNGANNYGLYVPAVSFGGGQEPGEVSFNTGQLPATINYWVNTFDDALSKTWRSHNIKAGIFVDRGELFQGNTNAYLGSYAFGGSSVMANDVQDGFGNAFLGNFNNYTEGKRSVGAFVTTSVEAFIQDSWRVNRRLTLDLGVRFYRAPPYVDANYNSAEWVRSTYNPAQAERLYYPGCSVSTASGPCPTASQYAIDLGTQTKTFYSLVGTYVPAAVGGYATTPILFPGMQVANGSNANLPLGLYQAPAFAPAPRFGFAWDVFGNGKTAIRGGFGDFLNRGSTDQVYTAQGQAPVTYNRAVYYTSVNQVPGFANSAAVTPASAVGLYGHQKLEGSYNGSFMIQQNVGLSTVVEASWVFNLRRHMTVDRQFNYIPMFGEYDPSWASPVTGYLFANASGKDLSDDYFRPIQGMSNLSMRNFEASSDYHSLQVSMRRNMTRHLSYGLAYTFAKTMNLSAASPYFTDKYRNWQPVYSPTPHVLAVNYVYEVPNLGHRLNLKALGWITDHWSIAGVTQWHSNLRSGVPGISFSGTNAISNAAVNFTGSAEGARMFVVGDPQLPAGQASFVGGAAVATSQGNPATIGYGPNGTPGNQLINESAFLIPFPCSYTPAANPHLGIGESMECFGNAGAGGLIPIPNTRMNNWDMTFSKSFPLKSERRVLMFRAEMYNVFNHTQFSGYNVGPQYDWSNWKNGALVQTNSQLGRFTNTLNPRQMSMSLRLQF